MERRRVTWMQQQRRSVLRASYTSPEVTRPTVDFGALGIEQVTELPAYDNGAYFVIDVTKDLEWVVFSTEGVRMRTFPIDKYAAIEWADRLKESSNDESPSPAARGD